MSDESARAEIRDAIAKGEDPGAVWDEAADTAGDDNPDEAQTRRRAEGDSENRPERR